MTEDRMSAAAINLNGMLAAVRVSGNDAGTFLHAQLTADIAALQKADGDRACYAAYCSPKGRVLATLFVLRQADQFLLLVDPGLVDALVQRLRMYVLRADVTLEPDPDLGVAGRIPESIQTPIAEGSYADLGMADPHRVQLPDGRVMLLGAKGSDTGSDRGTETWRELNIAQGVAWVGQATADLFVPQMLALDTIGAVSFSKGCYPGQEVVARARYLGKIKRHLRRFESDTRLEAGQSILSQETPIARVVDCVSAGNGTFVGHAVVRLAQDDRETEPTVRWR